jgi:signal transduction histidine kinase
MLSLIPSGALYYDEFWQTIRRHNLWFIKLRYGAVIMLAGFIVSTEFLLNLNFTSLQIWIITIITFVILLYNLLFWKFRNFLDTGHKNYNPLHFSLIQMVLDLTALWLLVYYTGGIETPLYMFFIFHMIIGSLILPGWIIYIIASWFLFGFTGLAIAEYAGLVEHHGISGFLKAPVYNDAAYVFTFCAAFIFVVYISVMLANRIANKLYKMEQELVETLNKLEDSEKEKQKYIISVLHEVKTPLAALHICLDTILQKYYGPVTTAVEDKLLRARLRSEEAMALIKDVLRISRVKLIEDFNREDVRIEELLSLILEQETLLAKCKDIEIVYRDNRGEKTPVKGDRFWLELVFSNLLNNAVKYSVLKGKIVIEINKTGNYTEVDISDNGIGIPEEELPHIFGEFYRASNTRLLMSEGSGLGLSIVKQIVDRHSGTIEAKSPSAIGSENQPGSSFIVRLPLK